MAYHDLITYCADTQALLAEVAKIAPDKLIEDEQDNPVGFSIAKTPTVRNGAETLAIVRVDDEELKLVKSLKSLKLLAEVPAGDDPLAAMSKANRAIYDRVYDQTPQPVLDEQGNQVGTYTPPALCGSFA